MNRNQTESGEYDTPTSSDKSAPTAGETSSGSTRDGRTGERAAESSRQDSDNVTTSPSPDVTTQSVLLALIAQPILNTGTQSVTQVSSGEQTNTAMESVMASVMEDGTSLPVTAADSSTFPQVDIKAINTRPIDPTAAIQAGAVLPSAVDATIQPIASPDQDMNLSSQARSTPESLHNLPQEKPTFPLSGGEGPHASATVEAKYESMVQPNDQRSAGREALNALAARTADQVQRPEDNRPVVMERPVPAQGTSGPKEEVVSRQTSIASTAWQEPTNQKAESGMEWSGRDHRDRPSSDQGMVQSPMLEVSGTATPAPSTLMTNGMDHRAFSSAPSAKLPADSQPTAPNLPVQPTDWMPGTSSNQTKSMVLELSQADLGRVNIRVAVNQDTVHAHFSSERNEIGQYLVSGQDRLQSALNGSGLDLGRFQVDIDRQSAGRSFQEPTSQGQTHGHTRQGEGRNSGQGREEAARENTPRRGMLNLVA